MTLEIENSQNFLSKIKDGVIQNYYSYSSKNIIFKDINFCLTP